MSRNIRWRGLAVTMAVVLLLAAFATMTTALAGLPASATNTVRESPALAAAPTPGQYYRMQVVRSGLHLEVAFASTDFAPIIQAPGAPNYRPSNWRFDAVDGGLYRIVNRNGGNCLRGGSASVRLVINQNTCNTSINDLHWTLTPTPPSSTDTFRVTNRTSGLSLCIIGNLTFAAVPLVSDLQGSCDQRIKLIPVS